VFRAARVVAVFSRHGYRGVSSVDKSSEANGSLSRRIFQPNSDPDLPNKGLVGGSVKVDYWSPNDNPNLGEPYRVDIGVTQIAEELGVSTSFASDSGADEYYTNLTRGRAGIDTFKDNNPTIYKQGITTGKCSDVAIPDPVEEPGGWIIKSNINSEMVTQGRCLVKRQK